MAGDACGRESVLMPWGRLDDSLYDHPKLDALGRSRLPAVGLNTLAQSWCNRWLTDGVVPSDRIPRLGGTAALAELLVTAGLWEHTDDGYRIHDFLDYNDSRDDVLAQRASARQRMRTVRRNKRDGSPDVPPNVTGTEPEVPPAVRVPRGRVPGPSSPALATPDPAEDARDEDEEPELEALQWLGKHGCYLRPGDGYHQKLILAVEKFGINRVVGTLDRLARAGVMDGDTKGFVFGVADALFPKPDLQALDREERADKSQAAFDRGVERTQRLIREQRGESA